MDVIEKIRYSLKSGKNAKWRYYLRAYFMFLVPSVLLLHLGKKKLLELKCGNDWKGIEERINYYCKLDHACSLSEAARCTSDMKMTKQKVYFFDSYEIVRFFHKKLRWILLPGDITYVPDEPTVVKSRPLVEDNKNSVILKLDKVRHFIFVDDSLSFEEKKTKAIFRGKVTGKAEREMFMRKYFGSEICDCGDVGNNPINSDWKTEKLTIKQHLQYKFIMALEGNDVASNLKWIMSSNSIAVMPKPTCETWFMEGKLLPDHHYIEIKPDFSDLKEKLQYYSTHIEEAKRIISNAHEFVAQFRDSKKEQGIAIGVMAKYFEKTNGYSFLS